MSNIFDLTLLPSDQLTILKSMDKTTQFETIKRFLDIYRLSGAKKIEKFFFLLLLSDLETDFYLKFDIFCSLKDHLTIKNKLKIFRVFDTLVFLILQTMFIVEEHWLVFLQLVQHFDLCEFSDVETLLKNVIILGFKKLKDPFKKISTLINTFSTRCRYATNEPPPPPGSGADIGRESRHPDRPERGITLLWLYIYNNYKNILTVQNNLVILQIVFEGENEFLGDLLSIARDGRSLSVRLEACDILFLKGSSAVKAQAQHLIETLVPQDAYTTNKENAHLSSIAASVNRTLDLLLEKNRDKTPPQNLYNILLQRFSHQTSLSSGLNVKGSLYRIFNYNFLRFTSHHLTLKEVIENVCLFIDSFPPETQQQLYTRLEQELDDMYNTCSQGYLTRLINVFSGFGVEDVGISIAFEDQIYAIFSLKVNERIAAAPEELKDTLLEELTVSTNEPERRMNLTRYLRPYLSKIWNEIFDEFSVNLTTTDLDLYCRKVLLKYEGNF